MGLETVFQIKFFWEGTEEAKEACTPSLAGEVQVTCTPSLEEEVLVDGMVESMNEYASKY